MIIFLTSVSISAFIGIMFCLFTMRREMMRLEDKFSQFLIDDDDRFSKFKDAVEKTKREILRNFISEQEMLYGRHTKRFELLEEYLYIRYCPPTYASPAHYDSIGGEKVEDKALESTEILMLAVLKDIKNLIQRHNDSLHI